MTRSLVIGIDASTTACKAIAWDHDGHTVAEGRASYPLLQPEPNWYEQDAEQWWRGTCVALREVLDQVTPAQVDALCITHQRESFVPVDTQGQPIRNAILWLDERCRAQVAFLEQAIGGEQFHRITGKPLTTNPSLPKIVWLMQHEPEIVAHTCKFLDTHAFLVHRFTNNFRTSLACADPMGLVDIQTHTWAADVIHELSLRPDQFPDLVPPGTIIGHVSDAAAAATATGLPAGLPVVAGAGDGQCAGLGANATGGGRASLNLGTAVVSGVVHADYLTDRAFRTLYAPVAGSYFLEAVIQGGAFTVDWFVTRFASDLNHAMTPYWDPAASGITIGWTGAHGREHFYRAILEGIAFEQRLVGDGMMAATGQPFNEYVALGGGSRSDLWCQIVADVTGVPVARSTTVEATCLGAGMLAATTAGWYPDVRSAADSMTGTAERFVPHPETHAIYERLYREVYQPLFPTLQPLIHRLTELTHDSIESGHPT